MSQGRQYSDRAHGDARQDAGRWDDPRRQRSASERRTENGAPQGQGTYHDRYRQQGREQRFDREMLQGGGRQHASNGMRPDARQQARGRQHAQGETRPRNQQQTRDEWRQRQQDARGRWDAPAEQSGSARVSRDEGYGRTAPAAGRHGGAGQVRNPLRQKNPEASGLLPAVDAEQRRRQLTDRASHREPTQGQRSNQRSRVASPSAHVREWDARTAPREPQAQQTTEVNPYGRNVGAEEPRIYRVPRNSGQRHRQDAHSSGQHYGGGHGAQGHSHSATPTADRSVNRRTFIGIGLVAAAAAAGGIGYLHYDRTAPVKVALADESVSLPAGTTYQDLIDQGYLTPKPGDLLAVDNSTVITAGGGEPYVIYEDGHQVTDAHAKVKRNARVSTEDGADDMEPYTDTEQAAEPQLQVGGVGAIAEVTQRGKAGKIITRTGSLSGMSVDASGTEAAQDTIVQSYNVSPSEKLVALTFDDGPTAYTPKYLDILAQYGAKATFFTLGKQIPDLASYVKRAHDEGHQIATHSYSHPNMFTLSQDQIREEITKGLQAIKDAIGEDVHTLRAPYGNWKEKQWPAVIDIIDRHVIWNVDTEDWRLPGSDAIVNTCLKHTKPGSVILMHDGGGNRDQDVEALPQILSQLQAQGYRFVTIDELASSGDHVQG